MKWSVRRIAAAIVSVPALAVASGPALAADP
jgi:hypothetical protein